jgi:membrane fusion protein, multidrug efflux system
VPENVNPDQRRRLGRIVTIAIICSALITGGAVVYETTEHPRTDDAEIFANFIGIAPQVEGPILKLAVRDDAFIKQGGLLFEIDPRPYDYALQKTLSDQSTLNGQIEDESRTIASQVSAVEAARAYTSSTAANVHQAAAAVDEARANVLRARAALDSAKAEKTYQTNNYNRIQPLLAQQFVTADQVDQAKTAVTAKTRAVDQASSELAQAEAQVESATAQFEQAKAVMLQSQAQLSQSQHSVLTLEPLTNQRGARSAANLTAEYNLNNCSVYAPFDARVTNLIISQGAYAHIGQQLFTLIDTRVWWAVANFRETQLSRIRPGMHAYVYALSRPNVRYEGIVDSVGYGVQADTTQVGSFSPGAGLPDVQRSLNWVHLATRFPVRVRILAPETEPFRLSESAVVVIQSESPGRSR